MPKKVSPSANKNIPVSENVPAAETEEQLAVSGIANTETNPETMGASCPTPQPTGTVNLPTTKTKTPQKSWAAIASSGATTSKGAVSTSSKTASASSHQPPQKSWAAMAATSTASTSREVTSASQQIKSPQISWEGMASSQTATPRGAASTSRAPTPIVTKAQKIKITELLTELKNLNKTHRDYPRKITTILYEMSNLRVELNSEEKLALIAFASDINLDSWSNINFVHLFISLNHNGVFDKDIPQDTDKKQAELFKKLVEITEEVLYDPKIYRSSDFYSFLSRILKAISTSSPSLINLNKELINRTLKEYIHYIKENKNITLNSHDIYQLVTAIYELKNTNTITEREANELAMPYILDYDIIKDIHDARKKKLYLFVCRNFINKCETSKANKAKIEAIYNQAIDSIDPNSSDIYEPFYLFNELNFLFYKKLINIENCKIESLMKSLEGKIHTLIDKAFFGKFHINLYNLETTSFAKTKIYEKLAKEYHACLKQNIHRIDPASIARIEAHIARSKLAYISDEKLDATVADNLRLMLNKICSESSALTKENCLASLNVFSRKMSTHIHWEHFQHFKERIVPILLTRYPQLTYDEKIQLVKVLPLTKNERNDRICKDIITELCDTFMANTDEYLSESATFLNAMANLGDYNLNMNPFIDLSRKALAVDESCNKKELFISLNFYSFIYAYFILQKQEKSLPQKQLNSIKEEMREKLALTLGLIESQGEDSLFNDDLLMLNYAHGLLKTDKQYKVNYSYTGTNIQTEIYNALADEYKLEKEKDIQLETSLFGLPGIDIYLNKYQLALEIDGEQHYQGAENSSVGGKSLVHKAILAINGIHLINIANLTRRKSLILDEVKQQIDAFLRKQEDGASD